MKTKDQYMKEYRAFIKELSEITSCQGNTITAMRYLVKAMDASEKIGGGNYTTEEWVYQNRVVLWKQRMGSKKSTEQNIRDLMNDQPSRRQFFNWLKSWTEKEAANANYFARWLRE